MTVWAIADLHLSLSVPEKNMDIFGVPWDNYHDKIKKNWLETVKPEDLVLIPGDITWAMKLEQAKIDLDWIDALPGTKVMIKGNHDYWWDSLKKLKTILPPSIHLIQNNCFNWQDITIGGSRLWDSNEYSFESIINYKDNPKAKHLAADKADPAENEKIFERELVRLETSLKAMPSQAKTRIVMTHYPPISYDLKDSRVSALLKKYQINYCLFGHLHNVKKDLPIFFGNHQQIDYIFCAADYLNFVPVKVCESIQSPKFSL